MKDFFASFDSLIIRKIRSDAYLCRSSHFGVNDDNDNDNNNNDRRTKRLLYPLLRMRARGNNNIIIPDTSISSSSPTMNTLLFITLPNGTTLRIINEIGVHYEQLGTLLLKDESGKLMEVIDEDERKVSKKIMRVFREWLEGRGLKPTWETLLQVLKMMKLDTLAENIACGLNHMMHSHQRDEH